MSGYTTVLFDLDGTLLNTLEDLHLTLNHALASCGLPEREFAETRRFVGNGIRRLVEQAVPEAAPQEVTDEVFAEFNRWYARHCNRATRPYKGILDLVAELRGEGLHCAVVSNKSDYAVQELVDAYFPGVFEAVLGVRDGLARKPNRDMVDAALAEMGPAAVGDAREGRAVYVGDSEVDLATAANSGLPCIIVTWGFRAREQLVAAGATTLVDSPAQLRAAIRKGR